MPVDPTSSRLLSLPSQPILETAPAHRVGGGLSPFAQALGQAQRNSMSSHDEASVAPPGEALNTPMTRARRGAEQLVATALIQPILQHLRTSNKAAAPFGQTQASKTFGAKLDIAVSESITRSGNFHLVDRVAKTLAARAAGGASEVSGSTEPLGTSVTQRQDVVLPQEITGHGSIDRPSLARSGR